MDEKWRSVVHFNTCYIRATNDSDAHQSFRCTFDSNINYSSHHPQQSSYDGLRQYPAVSVMCTLYSDTNGSDTFYSIENSEMSMARIKHVLKYSKLLISCHHCLVVLFVLLNLHSTQWTTIGMRLTWSWHKLQLWSSHLDVGECLLYFCHSLSIGFWNA